MSLKKGLGRVMEEESNSENNMEPSDAGAVYLGIDVAKQKSLGRNLLFSLRTFYPSI